VKKYGQMISFFMLVTVLILSGCSSSKPTADQGSNASASSSSGSAETINIGAIYNLTGGFAGMDVPSLNGLKLAADEINASGGVLGKKIKLVSIDGKSDPAISTTAVQELVNQNKVKVVVGLNDTTYVLASGPIAQKAGIPFVTPGATDPGIPDQVGDYMFMAAFGDDVQAHAAADFALNDLKTNTAWIFTDTSSDYTLGLSKYFKERFTQKGGQVLLEDKFDGSADVDFSTQITRLKSLKEQPKILFVSAQPDKAGIIVKQLRDMGVKIPVLGGDGYDTPDLVKLGGVPQTNDTYFTTHVALGNTSASVQNFSKNYKAKFGIDPENAFAALSYDTMQLIADAIKRAGTDDSKKIRDALASTKGFKGVTGTISFEKSRVPLKSVTIIKVNNGKYEFVKEVTPN
jgi:branched-chain amino acid transport system substrate-binding protein